MKAEPRSNSFDILAILVCAGAYALLEYLIADPTTMTEGDLYRMLFGLLDGKASGLGLLDVMHYGTSFSFGYLAFIYHAAGADAFHHPLQLIAFMNHFGYVCAVATTALVWCCTRAAYGSLTASATTLLFAFSPVFITLGSAGHPILPAYMFLMAGGALIFLEKRRTAFLGYALLLVGMTMRADIAFAMPWIALTHRRAASWGEYGRKVAGRAMLLAVVFIGFLVVRHLVIGSAQVDATTVSHGQSLASYLREFFRKDNIIGGIGSGLFGAGPATVMALAVVCIALIRRERLTPQAACIYAGPIAIIALALAFWVPVGINARHFITFTLGASLLIGLTLTARPDAGRIRVLGLALLLVLANQVVSEAVRPLLVRVNHSGYIAIPDAQRTLTMSPIGLTPAHVTTLQQRHRTYQEWITGTLDRVCDAKTVVMMDYDDAEQAMSQLYEGTPTPSSHLVASGDFKRIVAVTKGAQTLIFISQADAWPADPLADVLARPDLAGATVLIDPYAVSTYNHVPLPPERAARIGCNTLFGGTR